MNDADHMLFNMIAFRYRVKNCGVSIDSVVPLIHSVHEPTATTIQTNNIQNAFLYAFVDEHGDFTKGGPCTGSGHILPNNGFKSHSPENRHKGAFGNYVESYIIPGQYALNMPADLLPPYGDDRPMVIDSERIISPWNYGGIDKVAPGETYSYQWDNTSTVWNLCTGTNFGRKAAFSDIFTDKTLSTIFAPDDVFGTVWCSGQEDYLNGACKDERFATTGQAFFHKDAPPRLLLRPVDIIGGDGQLMKVAYRIEMSYWVELEFEDAMMNPGCAQLPFTNSMPRFTTRHAYGIDQAQRQFRFNQTLKSTKLKRLQRQIPWFKM
jgi:hypothetical protein